MAPTERDVGETSSSETVSKPELDNVSDRVKGIFEVVLVTLFPDFFESPLRTSLLGRAIERGDVRVRTINPRDFASDRHRTVDDTPYGGGPGMVLKVDVMVAAIEAAKTLAPDAPVLLLTPQGQSFSASWAAALAKRDGVVLVCGRYEGFDERIRSYVDGEVSIGDYVLSGGECGALVIVDAVSRFVSGVLGNDESTVQESFADGRLEYPQYTRPVSFRDQRVPDILLSGDHGRIALWRRSVALTRTKTRRPDLYEQLVLDKIDRKSLREFPPDSGN